MSVQTQNIETTGRKDLEDAQNYVALQNDFINQQVEEFNSKIQNIPTLQGTNYSIEEIMSGDVHDAVKPYISTIQNTIKKFQNDIENHQNLIDQAMKETAQIILNDSKSERVDKNITPVKEIFQFVGHDKITEQDRENSVQLRTPIIIPSAGKDPIFTKTPKSLISINKKPIIEHQMESIKSAGFKNIVLINGYKLEDFSILSKNENITIKTHTEYKNTHILHSLMAANPYMDNGFILLFSDILFDPEILKKLTSIKSDIVLGIDNSFTYNNQKIDKKLDLVVRKKSFQEGFRSLNNEILPEITRIGKNIDPKISDYEFIGIAYFSEKGTEILKNTFKELNNNLNLKNNFHEAKSFKMSSITDIIQEIINRGYLVNGLEVRQGWREIHSPEDIQTAEKEIAKLDQT